MAGWARVAAAETPEERYRFFSALAAFRDAALIERTITYALSDEVRAQVTSALEQNASHISLTDAKGSSYIVPTANLAYIELGTEESRRVGFVA